MTTEQEKLGPAERIIQSLLAHSDHMVHNRPGIVIPDARTAIGVRWEPVTYKTNEDGTKSVSRLVKQGSKNTRVPVGTMTGDDLSVKSGSGSVVGIFRPSGIYPEVALWFYQQVAEVWKLDNEFAAKWASYAFTEEHKDLKVVLSAFMLVQSRKGDPVVEAGETLFHDEDYRNVGEAMMLIYRRNKTDLNPKLLLRIHDILTLPAIAEINRELGFGKSARRPFLGRWTRTVDKWLRYREENPKLLDGLVRAGFRNTTISLARRVGYKPTSDKFFETLRWKQKQAGDGRRDIAIGKTVKAAESWAGLNETQVCERIVKDKTSYKRIVSLVPSEVGITRAVMAAAIEAGSLSDKDLIILTPTLEELGLLQVQDVRERWEKATKNATDMRAANIAKNVRSQEVKDVLEVAADTAVKEAVKEVVNNLRIYFMVDISGSMHGAIEAAKTYVSKLLQAFPPENVHVAVFNTTGKVVTIRHSSTAGVANAFRGIQAGGGTDYASGVRALQDFKPKADEDSLFIFVGDEQAGTFQRAVTASGLNPLAFGLLKIVGGYGMSRDAVQATATGLGIPCFMIDEATFDDVYAIPRTLRALVASTPVGQRTTSTPRAPRVTLVDRILKTDLLEKPNWA